MTSSGEPPMRTPTLAAVAFVAAMSPAFSQTPSDHQGHNPAQTPAPQPQAQPPSSSQGQMPIGQMPLGQMMQSMPEQCRSMMQSMPQNCMGMMQQMMQTGMAGSGMPGMQSSPSTGTGQSEAAKGYASAVDKMHGPMMQGI